MHLKCYQFNLKQLIKNDIFMIFIFFNLPLLDPLFHFKKTSNWEGIIINNTIQIFKKSQIPLYISLIQICKRKIIYPIGKIIKIIILSIFNCIKTKIIVVLCIFKFLSLVNLKILSNFLYIFPCGYYIVDRFSFDSTLEPEYLNSLLQIDIDIMFIIILLFISLIILNIINLMIIFIIMIFLYNYKIYRFFLVINIILPVYNIKLLIKWCQLFFFISINIFNILNIGLSPETLLFILNGHFNKIYEFFISNISIQSFMGNEPQTILITNSDNSQPSSYPSSLIYSNSDKHISSENILDKIDTSESDITDNDISNKIENEEIVNNIDNFIFTDFNKDLNLEEKYQYLKYHFYTKGIVHNIPYLDWFINLLDKTDGSKTNIDNIIEFNLNQILKMERETQLNNLAFFRTKPFLINKFDHSPIAFPNIIPVFKCLYIYEDIIEGKK
uniref:Uncharacterized protein n=1 Tax=Tricholoma flavovirens TaxID=80606 RepID=A0A6C0W673_9AGAR|nr:hypothetical protein [Tricholoma flavovirens]QIC20252.1 hypothetical protein [Tricholoma flavovirens]